MKNAVLIFALTFIATAYAIEGGHRTLSTDSAITTTVRVYFETDSGPHFCSGTLVSKDIVITASHCLVLAGKPHLEPEKPELFYVSLMSFPDFWGNIDDGYQATVVDYRYHDGFKNIDVYPYTVHDIAVLKIRSSEFRHNIQYAKIAELSSISLNQNLVIAAFGPSITDPDSGKPLRQVEVPLMSLDHQNERFSVEWGPENNKGLNLGDSGGPVYLFTTSNSSLVGVISSGNGFTFVPAYWNWLSAAILEMGGEALR